MNDYAFGNYLCTLRQKAGLTQAALAEQLGVTNKAVSKWENGKAKPTTDLLKKLAAMFDVSLEKLLQMEQPMKPVEITKIVITGGPCAGKSTAMSWIQNAFTQKGYGVLFVPETATELITGGVTPWDCGSVLDYQSCQFQLQLEKERVYEQAARTMAKEKILIVCDRGTLDNKAYMTDLEFNIMLSRMDIGETELRDQYDAVFHLVTAAKGAEQYYTTANNEARRETPEEAAVLDDKLIAAWTGHPHFRVIDNSSDFEGKMKRLIKEISVFLGEPEPVETERKFLIEYPDVQWLEKNPTCQRVEIIQTYLNGPEDEEVRVRQRGLDGSFVYFKTIKRTINHLQRVEVEQRLSQVEYLQELMHADTTKRQIRKTRYCLTYESQYFEIDVFPFWQDKALMEIELCDEEQEIIFPKQITVMKEVTEDENYKNAVIAQMREPTVEASETDR